MGLITVISSPDLTATHSLLIKRPGGCVYVTPFNVVTSWKRFVVIVMMDVRAGLIVSVLRRRGHQEYVELGVFTLAY